MIPERSFEVLRAIVSDYIATREPVGSKTLVDKHGFGVSTATIRNDMAILEEEQLITAPHTSAGRIPTDKGYRMFVDRLSEVRPLSPAERTAIENFLQDSADLDDVLGRTVRVLSKLTNQVAMVQYPVLGKARVQAIEFVRMASSRLLVVLITDTGRVQQHVVEVGSAIGEEFLHRIRSRFASSLTGADLSLVATRLDGLALQFAPEEQPPLELLIAQVLALVDANRQDKIILAGAANLARSESDFGGTISPVLEAIEQQVVLLKLIAELQSEQHGVSVLIGKENQFASLANASVVVAGYENQGSEVAKLGIIGPTRMDYSSNMASVLAVARYLTKTLG
ncbi:MAG: heat-inducible transcriptional repressor HrcA [Micrococcales bacterium]